MNQIHFDGFYVCHESDESYMGLLRFFEDGTVISCSIKYTKILSKKWFSEVLKWFIKDYDHSGDFSVEYYDHSGAFYVKFSCCEDLTKYGYNIDAWDRRRTLVDYEGKILDGGKRLHLSWYSHVNMEEGREEYIFKPFPLE